MDIYNAKACSIISHNLTTVFITLLVLSAAVNSIIPALPAFGQTTGNISDNSGVSFNAQVATASDNVYAVWQDTTTGGGDIYFKASTDGGDSFASVINLSGNAGASTVPQIAAVDDNVYVTWQDTTTGGGDIYFVKSADDGASFASASSPFEATTGASTVPQITATGDNVYVVWQDATTGSGDIYFKASTDGGDSFASVINLSGNAGASTVPQITATGDNVYVVWRDKTIDNNGDIYLKASTDNGATFGSTQVLSPAGTHLSDVPQITATGDNVYVVWQETLPVSFNNEIYISVSNDFGATFASTNLSSNADASYAPTVSASGTYVYVAWRDVTGLESGNSDIFFKKSADNGASFDSDPMNLSNRPLVSDIPQMATSEDNVFVIWEDAFLSASALEILLAASTDNGASFTDPINLSDTSSTNSRRPQVAASSNTVNAVWEDFLSGSNVDIFVSTDIDYLVATISVDNVDNTSPKWGVDTIIATGSTTSADPGDDTVTVQWGTGETDSEEVEIAEDGSWTTTHQYTISAVNSSPHQIIAKIIDGTSGDTKATSNPFHDDINVQPHDTALELENIGSVVQGSGDEIIVTGTLIDVDTEDGIDGQTITFDGAGTSLFPADPIVTDSDGIFSFTSKVQTDVASNLDVQAHFAGTPEYAESDSNVVTYDVVDTSVVSFDVDAGEDVSVELSDPDIPQDFDASITFDKLLTSGTIFVQECESPDSDRYEALQDRCLEISLDTQMELGSFAHVTLAFDEDQIPDGYSESDVELFHEDDGTIIDITESKNMDTLTVTGETESFSKFILGAAIHDEEIPTGAIRQPIYVGQENVITFRDVENQHNNTATITLDKTHYDIGDTALLTIVDEDANLDINEVDTITALVASETSLPDSITIELGETGINTNTFEGNFHLVRTTSSGNNLQARSGDGITVNYDPWIPGARFKAVIEGVTEAGMIQISDSTEDIDDPEEDDLFQLIVPVVIPIKIELVDAQLSDEATITVTMSYANNWVHGCAPNTLSILYMDPTDNDWTEATIGGSLAEDASTLQASSHTSGNFVTGCSFEAAGPGGSGGGLGKPGTGVVLDFIASIRQSGGGHHDAPSPEGGSGGGINVTPRGNVEINAPIEGATDGSQIKIVFETLMQDGHVVIQSEELSELADTFTSVDDDRGTTTIDGSHFTTAGPIYDIDTSDLEYSGSLEVTVPYDEDEVLQIGSESDLRLLHYDGAEWQDVTTDVNTENNTISGKMASTSPIAIAVVNDGTFSDEYFVANPTTKVGVISDDQRGPTAFTSGESPITRIKNFQRSAQTYVFIVQLTDESGVVQSISLQEGVLAAGETAEALIKWMPEEKGSYGIRIFIWDDLNDPSALSNATSDRIYVG